MKKILLILLILQVVHASVYAKKMLAVTQSANVVHYCYTGQEIENEFKEKSKEMYCFRARQYDPKQRRFLSPDKMKQQWGAYTYVGNDPDNYIDIDGKVKIFVNQKGEITEYILSDKFLNLKYINGDVNRDFHVLSGHGLSLTGIETKFFIKYYGWNLPSQFNNASFLGVFENPLEKLIMIGKDGYANAKENIIAVSEAAIDNTLDELVFHEGITQIDWTKLDINGKPVVNVSGLGGNGLKPLKGVVNVYNKGDLVPDLALFPAQANELEYSLWNTFKNGGIKPSLFSDEVGLLNFDHGNTNNTLTFLSDLALNLSTKNNKATLISNACRVVPDVKTGNPPNKYSSIVEEGIIPQYLDYTNKEAQIDLIKNPTIKNYKWNNFFKN